MKTILIETVDWKQNDTAHRLMLVYIASHKTDFVELGNTLSQQIERSLAPDEIVFLVREPSLAPVIKALKKDPVFSTVFETLPEASFVRVISFDRFGQSLNSDLVYGAAPKSLLDIAAVQRSILTDIFRRNNGLIAATESYHFRNPSGKHTRQFLRVSNVLISHSEISYIAFCLLPWVRADTQWIYIDTPSLFAVVGAINDILRSFDADPLIGNNFGSYAGVKQLGSFPNFENALVLISASTSGSLAKLIVDVHRINPADILHLFFWGDNIDTYQALVDLKYDSQSNPFGLEEASPVYNDSSCAHCITGSSIVELRGDQFHISTPDAEPLIVVKKDAPRFHNKSIASVVGKNATQVALASGAPPLKRELHLDFSLILKSPEFQKRLRFTAAQNIPASTKYFIIAEPGAAELAKTIKVACPALKLTPEVSADSAELEKLKANDAIVVLASVIESGRCLLDASRALRSIPKHCPITYFVGVEKCSQTTGRLKLEDNLAQSSNIEKHRLVSIDEVILPKSRASNSWEQEFMLWSRPEVKNRLTSDALEIREQRMKELSQPMCGNQILFFTPNEKNPINVNKGFVFWPSTINCQDQSHADIFFIVSSILQNLREPRTSPTQRQILKNDWLTHTLIDPENFNRYNDSGIQAAFLRASTRAELNYASSPKASLEMSRIIRGLLDAHGKSRGAAIPEFLLALVLGRMTLKRRDLQAVLEKCLLLPGIFSELAELIRLVLVAGDISLQEI